MNYVYHGSHVANLEKIKPNVSTHMNNWVYASPSKAISVIFLSTTGSDLNYVLSGDGVNYPVELVERKPNMFKTVFHCDGYIYKLDATNFKSGLTGWSGEVVSDKVEEVLDSEYISNVYNELLKLNDEGKIRLYLYPERPKNIPLDNSDLIPKVIRWHKNGFDISKFFEIYPELKEKYNSAINENA